MYITRQGQAWHEITKEVYGKEIHADFLMKSNPKQLDIFIFPAGIRLETPDIPPDRKNLPPWR